MVGKGVDELAAAPETGFVESTRTASLSDEEESELLLSDDDEQDDDDDDEDELDELEGLEDESESESELVSLSLSLLAADTTLFFGTRTLDDVGGLAVTAGFNGRTAAFTVAPAGSVVDAT